MANVVSVGPEQTGTVDVAAGRKPVLYVAFCAACLGIAIGATWLACLM